MGEQHKRRLQLLEQEKDPLKKSLLFLGIFTETLKSEGIQPILVGGRALEFYTLGGYATKDIDLVLNGRARADIVLREMGFQKQPGERHWYHEELDLALEIPGDYLAGSTEKLTVIEIEGLECYVIGVEDLIVDRLAAAKFWGIGADVQWAAKILALNIDDVDADYLGSAAQKADVADFLKKAWEQCQLYLKN